MYRWRALFFLVWAGLSCALPVRSATNSLGLDAAQMVVCLAPDTASSEGTLQLYQRDASGQWQKQGEPWPVLFGRKGLAWGRGLNPPQPGLQKKTNDGRNPMGLFKLGTVYGEAPALPDGSKGWPYHQVTDRDAWIDDAKLAPLPYNHLYTLPLDSPWPAWWGKERMHPDDFAYRWLVLVEANYDEPDPGAGNAIFLHVRRGEHYRTAGCTTMKADDLERLVAWLDPAAHPMLVELTQADYRRFWKAWHLPPPG